MLTKILFVSCFVMMMAVNTQQNNIPAALQEPAAALRAACVRITGASVDLIEACANGNFADDAALKCYMKCVFDQMAVIDDDGQFDIEGLISAVPPELADAVGGTLRTCAASISGSDGCENSLHMFKCFYEKNPANFFVI